MVEGTTRVQLVNTVVKRSLLDIIYTNKREKILGTYKDDVGRSDHQGVRVVIATKTKYPKAKSLRKRCYRRFNPVKFLYEVQGANIDTLVCQEEDVEEAANIFGTLFLKILNENAPIKTIQVHKNYNPHISEVTKGLIRERKT